MKSFLLIGQSNMAGRGFVHEVPPIYNERIEMLRNGRWQMMTEPVNYDRPVAGVSLAASFAEAWCRVNPGEKIGLIPCAEGGSSIDEWETEGVLFRHAVSEVKFAVENSELAGILWHQGESDSDSGKYKTYYEKLYRLVTDLREALNAADIPFIIGGLGDYLGKPHSVQDASSMNGSIRSCSGLLRRIRAVTLSRQKGLRQIRTESISMPFHRESLACVTLRLIVSGSISNSRWLRKTGSWTGVTTGIIQRRKRDIWHLKGLLRGKYHTKSSGRLL